MTLKEFKAGGPLKGSIRVPGDKSVSHRVLLLGALADGTSTIHGLSNGDDVARTGAAMASAGATVAFADGVVTVTGGRDLLTEPTDVVDLGNSGTGARLMCGWAATFPWRTTITGDDSLRSRPMMRVVDPMRSMGAVIEGEAGGDRLPLTISGGDLTAIDYRSPVRSAQVKTAILLAGLRARGVTTVHEEVPTRAHTEELLEQFGAKIRVAENADGSCDIAVESSDIRPFEYDVPCDPSQAAFWMVAAVIVPDSDVTLENVYVGPGRGGMIDVLMRMGADIDLQHRSSTVADVRVRHSQLRGTVVEDDEIASMIDELPVLSVAASQAEGETRVSDAAELRVKESDRIDAVVNEIGPLGLKVTEAPDGFTVAGRPGEALAGGQVNARLDHRIAMTAAIAGLVSDGPVTIDGWESVATSYPSFESDLDRLRSGQWT